MKYFVVIFAAVLLTLPSYGQRISDPEVADHIRSRGDYGTPRQREMLSRRRMAAQGSVEVTVWHHEGELKWEAKVSSPSPEDAALVIDRLLEEMERLR